VAVASAGQYASLHLAPDRKPHLHPTTQFFTGQMPFLLPNQHRQSTKGEKQVKVKAVKTEMVVSCDRNLLNMFAVKF